MAGLEEILETVKSQIEKAKNEVGIKEREHVFWQLIGHLLDTQELLLSKLRDGELLPGMDQGDERKDSVSE